MNSIAGTGVELCICIVILQRPFSLNTVYYGFKKTLEDRFVCWKNLPVPEWFNGLSNKVNKPVSKNLIEFTVEPR